MRDKRAIPDQVAARIAARQHGVLTLQQLLAAGMSRSGVSRRLQSGRLHSIHRGVYAVGHAGISQDGRWIAAALACGKAAVVSHRSAAVLWGLLRSSEGPVDIAVPGDGGRKSHRGIRLHRCPSLTPDHVTRRRGIPVTTPARTITDLRRTVPEKELRRAVRQADVLGLRIGLNLDHDRTRSDLEREFLRLCRRYGLPAPEVNVRVGRYLVDFLWRDHDLIVETDGYRYHRGSQAFEDDRARDLCLRASGFEVVRLSGRQVAEASREVAEVLRAALASSRHRVGADGS